MGHVYDRDDKMLVASIFISRFFTHFFSFPFPTTFISNLNHTSGFLNTLPLDTRNGKPFKDNGRDRDAKFFASGSASSWRLFVKERRKK
jgi:hypothetical protein